jgi:RimK family alpha-L-glutamate ligase
MRAMRVALLGEPGGWHLERLAEVLRSRGHDVATVRWGALAAGVGPGGEWFAPEAMARADAIVVRGMPGVAAGPDRLEEVVFRMDVLARLAARGTTVVNPPRALEIAIDKYLTLAVLASAGLPVPRTRVAQDADAAERAWDELGRDCVVKPVFGSRGRGLARVTTAAAAREVAAGGIAYLQEFLPHEGWDVRVLVVRERTFAMRRVAAAGEWRTNVSLGGRPEAFTPPAAWVDVAVQAAVAVGAEVAGIDLVPTADGRLAVLEVNAVPGWKGLQAVTDRELAVEIAACVEEGAGFGHRPTCP